MLVVQHVLKQLKKQQIFIFNFLYKEIKRHDSSSSLGYEIIKPWQVSKMRQVPDYIPKPSYYKTSIPLEIIEKIEIKNDHQIEKMKKSCKLAKHVLNQVKLLIKPGITTDQIDEQVHNMIINNGAYPSPFNYKGFPKSICTSINNVACHGIPDNRPLKKGDILNVDVTVYLDGYHGDCSEMFVVVETDENANKLIKTVEKCLNAAIKICKPNEKFSSIGNIIEETSYQDQFSVIPVLAGHGIGSYFHGPPDILHFANDYSGEMQPGMTFTIEPALSEGDTQVVLLNDGWTVVTFDNSRTVQMEHTILITNHGCEVLTVS
ncbi:methionine aminopeptidase 1D, mitochondrial [Chelonus insularis]|uniref:methionine aminopeptidase 1D, mitochondrial n=1 Tax=Chelonus insularis TaxID=460826 RepID=UPI00158ACEF6|nr:methionine aminopeptidase 1D, mitochondrial [Chelonus insularis]